MESRDLGKVYGEVAALQAVSLAVRSRDFVAICGPAGAGKSTLVKLLGFHDHPSAGQLYLEGRNVTELPAAEMGHLREKDVVTIWTDEAGWRRSLDAALQRRPTLLLVDGIEGSLPAAEAQEVLGLLKHWNQQGQAVLFTTRQAEYAAHATSVHFIREGKITAPGLGKPLIPPWWS